MPAESESERERRSAKEKANRAIKRLTCKSIYHTYTTTLSQLTNLPLIIGIRTRTCAATVAAADEDVATRYVRWAYRAHYLFIHLCMYREL